MTEKEAAEHILKTGCCNNLPCYACFMAEDKKKSLYINNSVCKYIWAGSRFYNIFRARAIAAQFLGSLEKDHD